MNVLVSPNNAETVHVHEDSAANAGVGAEAGDIIVEARGNVEANIVGNCEEQAIAGEASIDAEEDVTVSILVKSE